MQKHHRPVSPHIQIYKWQLTSVMSILHRMTGVFLCSLVIILVAWLVSLRNPDAFDCFKVILHHPLAQVYLIGIVFSLFYHLTNGVRHLLWDAGYGLDLKTTYRSGWLVLNVSLFATVFYVLLLIQSE